MMRVIHIVRDNVNPYFGTLVRGLRDSGLDVKDYDGYLSIRQPLRGARYDVVHVHFVPDRLRPFLDAFIRLAWYRLLGSRIVKTCHNIRPHSTLNPRLAFCFERLACYFANHVIFFTEEQRQEFVAYYGFSPRHFSIISHPYFDNYQNTIGRCEARASLGLGDDDFVYLLFGGVRAYKNYDRVIGAFQENHAAGDKLLVAIRPNSWNPIEAAAFARCQDLLAKDSRDMIVRIGFVPDEEVQRHFNAADVVLLPFTDNTSSASFMMAVAFEIPFIAVSNSFNRSVLPETCGIFVDSLENVSDAMKRIKASDVARMRREIASRKSDYEWSRIVAAHVQAYRSVVQGRGCCRTEDCEAIVKPRRGLKPR